MGKISSSLTITIGVTIFTYLNADIIDQSSVWSSGNITCSSSDQTCTINCMDTYSCGLENGPQFAGPHLHCPTISSCMECTVNCMQDQSCSGATIHGNTCRNLNINVEHKDNKAVTIYAPDDGGSLNIVLITSGDDHAKLKDSFIYAGIGTNNISIDCSSGKEFKTNEVNASEITGTLSFVSEGDCKSDSTFFNCPVSNQCFIDCSGGDCKEMTMVSSQGTRTLEFICGSGVACTGTVLNCDYNSKNETDCSMTGCSGPCVLPPTLQPTLSPTIDPSFIPTYNPSIWPSFYPSIYPTIYPTAFATKNPTIPPTIYLTNYPSLIPSYSPTFIPSYSPTFIPSYSPTFIPSDSPTFIPTLNPTFIPTLNPTFISSINPTNYPTFDPRYNPTHTPTFNPKYIGTKYPTNYPSADKISFASNDENSDLATIITLLVVLITIISVAVVLFSVIICLCLKKKYKQEDNAESQNRKSSPEISKKSISLPLSAPMDDDSRMNYLPSNKTISTADPNIEELFEPVISMQTPDNITPLSYGKSIHSDININPYERYIMRRKEKKNRFKKVRFEKCINSEKMKKLETLCLDTNSLDVDISSDIDVDAIHFMEYDAINLSPTITAASPIIFVSTSDLQITTSKAFSEEDDLDLLEPSTDLDTPINDDVAICSGNDAHEVRIRIANKGAEGK